MADPTWVLLINLGTPASPRTADVRRYLREFLSDPRVIDIPAVPRWLLVNAVIAPFRSPKSAEAYAKVWREDGSPLLAHGRALRDAVAAALGPDHVVALGMRYGKPSIAEALDRLLAAGVSRLVALPLFPQFAESSTGSALACLAEAVAARPGCPEPVTIRDYFADPGFIEAFAEVARPVLAETKPEYVLFSYHGLPERQVKAADASGAHCLMRDDCCDAVGAANRECYRAQCFATTRALARALELPPDAHSVAFQSRLGRTPWIGPYTDVVLPELAAKGIRRIAVMCPAFTADCLETLEEIGLRAREQWREAGGDVLTLVPSLNAHPRWVRAVAELVRAAA